MQKLAALEAEQQKLREEERKELEAQIAKVKNDANTSLADKDRKIAELNKQIADNIAKARAACNYSQCFNTGFGTGDDLCIRARWDTTNQVCVYYGVSI